MRLMLNGAGYGKRSLADDLHCLRPVRLHDRGKGHPGLVDCCVAATSSTRGMQYHAAPAA
jgi:hypothetical protein